MHELRGLPVQGLHRIRQLDHLHSFQGLVLGWSRVHDRKVRTRTWDQTLQPVGQLPCRSVLHSCFNVPRRASGLISACPDHAKTSGCILTCPSLPRLMTAHLVAVHAADNVVDESHARSHHVGPFLSNLPQAEAAALVLLQW